MKAKKILAALLAALMILSVFAACGNDTPASSTPAESKPADSTPADSTPAETSSSAGESADDVAWSPYGKYPETVTLTTAKRSSSAPKLLPGDDVDNNPMTKYILDKVNVKTVTDWEVEGSEFTNKLALMMTSDSLPDFFTLGQTEYLMFKQLLENEKLADLTEVYDKTINDYIKTCDASYDGKNLDVFRDEDGKLYGIAGGQYAYEHEQTWVRKDWLDASKMDPPTTVEEIEAVLTEWKNNPPSDEYVGMILHPTQVVGSYNSGYHANPIVMAYGAVPKMWIEKDGEVVYGSVQPEMKEGLKVLADWYAKGLIDHEFATRTASGSQDALWTGGQSGLCFAPWWGTYSWTDLPQQHPEADILPIGGPVDANGKFNVQGPAPAGEVVVVNKNCEHPEALGKIMNLEFDMWRGFDLEAKELIQPTIDNGVSWTYMFPTSGVNYEVYDCVPESTRLCTYVVEHEGSLEGAPENNKQMQDCAVSAWNWYNTKDFASSGNGWTEYYGRTITMEGFYDDALNIISPAYAYTTESMADLKPNLDTLENTTFLKIVMGEEPVDSFDQFVEDWYAQGGQTMTDEVRAMVG